MVRDVSDGARRGAVLFEEVSEAAEVVEKDGLLSGGGDLGSEPRIGDGHPARAARLGAGVEGGRLGIAGAARDRPGGERESDETSRSGHALPRTSSR
jgi:hypothetical protein